MKKILYSLTVIVCLAGLGLAYWWLSSPKISIPKESTKEVTFPIYIPDWLPNGYEIDKESFAWQEERVFVFSAMDKDRNKLFFTQQAKPKDFDFNNFYLTKVIDPEKLQGTPFESVYAKSLYGNTWLLSIVTDKSWIMMSTLAPIDRAMAQKIAQEMKEYDSN